ncbi:sensor histidine kinase [Terriglobus albidus]|uniref:sensor histidine kinase n=1 Tax=Terriglobus albidus TaxID=1592106 RepID=UPI0021DFCE3D|nr:ATP-binding protein [Terriglobus albidus]
MKRTITGIAVLLCVVTALAAFGAGWALSGSPVWLRFVTLAAIMLGISLVAIAIISGALRRDASSLRLAIVASTPEQQSNRPDLGDFQDLWPAFDAARQKIRSQIAAVEEERAKLAAVLDSMQDLVVAVDSAGRIQWANEPMRRELEGAVRHGQAIVHTIRDPEVLLCLQVALDDGLVTQRRSTSLKPGRIFEVNAGPIPGGGAVAVLHDLTRIEQVERTQREFIANVSHELRTPLTSISGYVETLLDFERSLSLQSREFLETILKNATRMTRLTEDLLVLARVESGENPIHPAVVSAEKMVRDAVASVRGIVRDAGAKLDLGVMDDVNVMADADATTQVLSNLIENATKYGRATTGEPARIEVSVEQKGGYAEFRIRDWGAGIASEHHERIFERFYRVDKARSRETGGTGLGLAIARHIVMQHGGNIWVESRLTQGSTFAFTLPAVQG